MSYTNSVNRAPRRSERLNPGLPVEQVTPPTSPRAQTAPHANAAENGNNPYGEDRLERLETLLTNMANGNEDRIARLETMFITLSNKIDDNRGQVGESTAPISRTLDLTTSPSSVALEGSFLHNPSIPGEYERPTERSQKESYSNPYQVTKLNQNLSNIGKWYSSILDYFQFEMWPFDDMSGHYKYVESENRAHAIVRTSLPPLMRRQTRDHTTPNQTLTYVRQHLIASNPTMIEDLKDKLHSFRWNNIQEAEERLTDVVTDIEATGHKVSEAEQIRALLRRPPMHLTYYTTDISASIHKDPESWNFIRVLNRLKIIDTKNKRPKAISSRNEKARLTEKVMHTSEIPRCSYCKKKGHTASKCHKRKRENAEMVNQVGSNDETIIIASHRPLHSHELLLDTGATIHMVCDLKYFVDLKRLENPINVRGVFGDMKTISYTGSVLFRPHQGSQNIRLTNVAYSPESSNNVLSTPRARENGIWVKSLPKQDALALYNAKTNALLVTAPYRKNHPILDGTLLEAPEQVAIPDELAYQTMSDTPEYLFAMSDESSEKESSLKEHRRNSHIGYHPDCIPCMRSKITKTIAGPGSNNDHAPGEHVVTDLKSWNVCTDSRIRYTVHFTDSASKYTKVYFLESKESAKTLEKFKLFQAHLKRQTGKEIKTIRTDGGSEYLGAFKNYIVQHGINFQNTQTNRPSMNGKAERMNRTINQLATTILASEDVPKAWWIHVVKYVVHTLNRTADRNGNVPIKLLQRNFNIKEWNQIKQPFGRYGIIYKDQLYKGTLNPRSVIARFIGYDDESNKLLTFIDGSGHLYRSREIKWLPEDQKGIISNNEISKIPFPNMEYILEIMDERKLINEEFLRYQEPKSYAQAIKHPDSAQWLKALDVEWDQLRDAKTFDIVQRPTGIKPITVKWVFKLKLKADGTIEKYKARMVAHGFKQVEDIDFDRTYSPVANIFTIRTFIVIVNQLGFKITQFDITTAYLHGDIDRELYLEFPPSKEQPGKVLKLNKALYGLKQSGRMWHLKFTKFMKDLNFKPIYTDRCLFYKKDIFVLIYVDDILVAGRPGTVTQFKEFMKSTFRTKELGPLHFIVGLEIVNRGNSVYLRQPRHIQTLLEDFELSNCTPKSTPMDTKYSARNEDEIVPDSEFHYRKAIGSLLYLSNTSRPDISAATALLSQKCSCPSKLDVQAVKRLLRYLKGSINCSLQYTFSTRNSIDFEIIGYSDSSYATATRRKSMGGYCILLNGNLVNWSSRKQSIVAQSSTEAEYIALANTAKSILWLRNLLLELGLQVKLPITLFGDNTAANILAVNGTTSQFTKHIEIRYHFLQDLIERKIIQIVYLDSKSLPADHFTKGLDKLSFSKHLSTLKFGDFKLSEQKSSVKESC